MNNNEPRVRSMRRDEYIATLQARDGYQRANGFYLQENGMIVANGNADASAVIPGVGYGTNPIDGSNNNIPVSLVYTNNAGFRLCIFKNNKELEDIGPICTMAMMGDTNMGGLLVIPVESYEAVLDGERELKRIRKLYNKHINNRNV